MKIFKLYFVFISFFLFFFLSPSLCKATDYYVATNGNDDNAGTQSQPFETIFKATELLRDKTGKNSIIVNEGVYEENVRIYSSGKSDSEMLNILAVGKVTIRSFYSYTLGNFIRLKGFTVTTTKCPISGDNQSSILIRGKNNIIENNTIVNSTRTGIDLSYDSSNNIVRNNKISHVYNNGIVAGGTNQLVENNEISFIVDHIDPCPSLQDVNGIEFTGSGHIFRGNYVHDFLTSLQNGYPHMDAFQTYGTNDLNVPWGQAGKNIVIEQNHIFMGDTATGKLTQPYESPDKTQGISSSGFMLEGSKINTSNKCENITIRNNIIEAHTGLNIGGGQNVHNLKIYNNTFNGDLRLIPNSYPLGINMYGNVLNSEIFNNVFVNYPTGASHIYLHDNVPANSTYGNNLFWNSDSTTPKVYGYVLESTDKMKVNPLFINNVSDFHLQSNSPAINSGKTISLVTNDYDGTPRPQGSSFDIGAFEYSSTPSCSRKSLGDANCDLLINGVDYSYWLNSQCRVNASQGCLSSEADFNKDGNIDDRDYGIWFENRGS